MDWSAVHAGENKGAPLRTYTYRPETTTTYSRTSARIPSKLRNVTVVPPTTPPPPPLPTAFEDEERFNSLPEVDTEFRPSYWDRTVFVVFCVCVLVLLHALGGFGNTVTTQEDGSCLHLPVCPHLQQMVVVRGSAGMKRGWTVHTDGNDHTTLSEHHHIELEHLSQPQDAPAPAPTPFVSSGPHHYDPASRRFDPFDVEIFFEHSKNAVDHEGNPYLIKVRDENGREIGIISTRDLGVLEQTTRDVAQLERTANEGEITNGMERI